MQKCGSGAQSVEALIPYLEDLQLIGFVRSPDALFSLDRGHLYRSEDLDLRLVEGERVRGQPHICPPILLLLYQHITCPIMDAQLSLIMWEINVHL